MSKSIKEFFEQKDPRASANIPCTMYHETEKEKIESRVTIINPRQDASTLLLFLRH